MCSLQTIYLAWLSSFPYYFFFFFKLKIWIELFITPSTSRRDTLPRRGEGRSEWRWTWTFAWTVILYTQIDVALVGPHFRRLWCWDNCLILIIFSARILPTTTTTTDSSAAPATALITSSTTTATVSTISKGRKRLSRRPATTTSNSVMQYLMTERVESERKERKKEMNEWIERENSKKRAKKLRDVL